MRSLQLLLPRHLKEGSDTKIRTDIFGCDYATTPQWGHVRLLLVYYTSGRLVDLMGVTPWIQLLLTVMKAKSMWGDGVYGARKNTRLRVPDVFDARRQPFIIDRVVIPGRYVSLPG